MSGTSGGITPESWEQTKANGYTDGVAPSLVNPPPGSSLHGIGGVVLALIALVSIAHADVATGRFRRPHVPVTLASAGQRRSEWVCRSCRCSARRR